MTGILQRPQMPIKKIYDAENARLIYLGEAASQNFWDGLWNTHELRAKIKNNRANWLVKFTNKYLHRNTKILEGGCGLGSHVYALSKNGYQAVGVDYAPETVAYLNRTIPELDIRLADVRNLPFEDESFDAYWSLGVIEHFWDGYSEIAEEMFRVLKSGGYLFITFPWMSPLRKYKAKRMRYELWRSNSNEPREFYQYALPSCVISENFIKIGFDLVYETGLDGVKGLKDELDIFERLLSSLYKSNNLAARVIKKIFNFLFSNYCGHIKLIILKKSI
jgi:SAM-dependent methyltransferase